MHALDHVASSLAQRLVYIFAGCCSLNAACDNTAADRPPWNKQPCTHSGLDSWIRHPPTAYCEHVKRFLKEH
jgi:hypothetical protein